MNKYDVLILILCYIFLPKVGYVWNGEMSGHLLFTFCHSNIFHLLCNIMVILSFKQKIRYEMYIISILCSFLPCCSDLTMGASGMIFAHIGYTWGKIDNFREMFKRNLLLILLTGLFPNMNMLIHLYCLLAGYLFGKGGMYVRRKRSSSACV